MTPLERARFLVRYADAHARKWVHYYDPVGKRKTRKLRTKESQ